MKEVSVSLHSLAAIACTAILFGSCGGNSERRLVGEVGGVSNFAGNSSMSSNGGYGAGAGALGGTASLGGSPGNSTGGTTNGNAQGGASNVGGQPSLGGTSSVSECNANPNNLVTNGDFCDGSNHWNVTYSGTIATDYSTSTDSGSFCIQNNTDVYAALTLGWPLSTESGVVLESGSSYTFSYSAGGTALTLVAKVGLTVSPWTAAFSSDDTIGTTVNDYSHTFTASSVLGPVGVAFIISDPSVLSYFYYPGQVCFDNVSLVKN